jgi:hypothetical protein
MSGYCIEGQRCVCGGDTAGVRAGCNQWREVTSGPKGTFALDRIHTLEAELERAKVNARGWHGAVEAMMTIAGLSSALGAAESVVAMRDHLAVKDAQFAKLAEAVRPLAEMAHMVKGGSRARLLVSDFRRAAQAISDYDAFVSKEGGNG